MCAARALELMAASAQPALRWTGRAALAVLAVGALHGSVGYVVWRQSIEPLTRERHRAGEVWVTQPMPELSWIESQSRPGDRIFVFPAGGGLFFLSRTRNATSFPYMLEGQYTVAQQERALAEIEENRPLVGVWYQGQRFVPRPGTASLDTLYRGIVDSYDAESILPNGAILLRRKSRAGAL
jgi:hypothetical protein